MNTETLLKNEYVSIVRNDTDITFYDLKDVWNDYKGFTQNKRGLNKATAFIKQIAQDERLKDDIKMGDVVTILEKFNLKPHTYCGMD
jgi:hypothetical protein